jgi:hypothetical protein
VLIDVFEREMILIFLGDLVIRQMTRPFMVRVKAVLPIRIATMQNLDSLAREVTSLVPETNPVLRVTPNHREILLWWGKEMGSLNRE